LKSCKNIKEIDKGVYYLKRTSGGDLAKIMDVEMDFEEFDWLVYRREITG